MNREKQNWGNVVLSFVLLCLAMLVMIIINYFTAPQFVCDTRNTKSISTEDINTERMIRLTNESRVEAGVAPLSVNEKLMLAADKKADDMFRLQYFEHNSPSGVNPWYFIRSSGYKYRYAEENIAMDFITSDGVQKALMENPTHKRNILNERYNEIGVAVKSGTMNGKKTILIVYHFGS